MTLGRSRFCLVDGVRTHSTESGDEGPLILAMHGGSHGSSGAAALGELFDLLGPDHRLIGLDSIGGFGETDPIPLRYGLQNRVDHAAAFVETLCLEHFTIMGNSQGAWCAARYAMQYPDRIENVILFASGSIAAAMGLERELSDQMKQLQTYDGTREAMLRIMRGLTAHPDRITDELVEARQRDATRPGAMEAFAASGRSTRAVRINPILFAGFDMRTALPSLAKQIPTACIWGEDDLFAPPELGRALEAMLPDVRFYWVPRAGHQVLTDQPEVVATLIRDFILQGSQRAAQEI